jgi:hypothetical protein
MIVPEAEAEAESVHIDVYRITGGVFDKECFFTIAYGQDGNMEKSPCQAPPIVRKYVLCKNGFQKTHTQAIDK